MLRKNPFRNRTDIKKRRAGLYEFGGGFFLYMDPWKGNKSESRWIVIPDFRDGFRKRVIANGVTMHEALRHFERVKQILWEESWKLSLKKNSLSIQKFIKETRAEYDADVALRAPKLA